MIDCPYNLHLQNVIISCTPMLNLIMALLTKELIRTTTIYIDI